MKPTEAQKQSLKAQLQSILLYRETGEEVYDHVLTAIEQRNLNGEFDEVVNKVIAEEFGGSEQLQQIERNAFQVINKVTRSKYWYYLRRQIIGPELVLTLLIAGGCFWLLRFLPHLKNTIAMLIWGLHLAPRAINWYRYFRQGYVYKSKVNSLRDAVVHDITDFPLRFLWAINTITLFGDKLFHVTFFNAYCLTALFTVGCAFLFAFIKLYRDELRLIMLTR